MPRSRRRWIAHPRPNETPIDLTAGLWLTKGTMLMAQSFNIVSAGDARPPYAFYRSHKIELSIVERLSRHWLLQSGVFFSPAGQNALVEKGRRRRAVDAGLALARRHRLPGLDLLQRALSADLSNAARIALNRSSVNSRKWGWVKT